jgi:hypothetical protein
LIFPPGWFYQVLLGALTPTTFLDGKYIIEPNVKIFLNKVISAPRNFLQVNYSTLTGRKG